MAERPAYSRDEVLSMVMCDDDYLMEYFEPGSDDELGFNSDVEEYKLRFLKKIHIHLKNRSF